MDIKMIVVVYGCRGNDADGSGMVAVAMMIIPKNMVEKRIQRLRFQ